MDIVIPGLQIDDELSAELEVLTRKEDIAVRLLTDPTPTTESSSAICGMYV